MSSGQYDDIVYHLYAGVTSPQGWKEAILMLRNLMNSAQATFLVHDKLSGKTLFSEQAKEDSQFTADYENCFFEIDPVRPIVTDFPAGRWFLDQVHLGRYAIEHDDFYQSFLRKYDLGSVMCCSLANDTRYLTGLAFQSGRNQEGFSEKDIERIAPVMPHLLLASRMRTEFQQLSELSVLGQAILDSLPSPILLINKQAKILFANQAGSRWLESSNHLFSQQKAVQLEVVRAAVSKLSVEICGMRPAPLFAVRVPEKGGKFDYLLGLSLSNSHPIAAQFSERVGLIIVRASTENDTTCLCIFRSLFGLTDAEVRFTEALCRSASVQDAAASIGITYQTARSYLKNIYEKTDCHTQASLQRLWVALTHDLPR